MKAISLLQPWATLIAIRAKTIETRSWSTKYTGPLAIHASGTMRKVGKDACKEVEILNALVAVGFDRYDLIWNPERVLPLGKVVATARLAHCMEIPEERKYGWYFNGKGQAMTLKDDGICFSGGKPVRIPPNEPEVCFGDYTPGRFAWVLEDVRPITPVEALGSLGLWEWEPK